MADAMVRGLVRAILDDEDLVAELRAALAPEAPVEPSGLIGHSVAAARWGVKPATVAGWCRSGRLEGRKEGKVWLVDPNADRPERAPRRPHRAPARRRAQTSVGDLLRGK